MAEEQNIKEEELNNESEAQQEDVESKNATQTEQTEEQQNEEVEELENELTEEEKLSQELALQKDKFLRLYSEFENFRKRTAKEKLELIATANEGLILSILPVIDDFDRAQKSFEEATDVAPLKEGVQLIRDKFLKSLESKGLTAIDTENAEFDTELHEAITQIPAPSEDMKGKVVDCVEKGYKLGDKVIRYSKVVTGA